MTTFTAEARLPHGFNATFTWSNNHLGCEWDPEIPRIANPRAWRKFLCAYEAERDAFLEHVSRETGLRIGVAGLDLKLHLIKPAERRLAA